ncbi:NTP transferase domain-containing protein [Curtobacterium sp. MCPF17_052]|uniref:acylneuraminate cytidylyltransferase family protein n=1 Tax=Curtobacterium sp. MCPF17_052 TaxID=2175655 RepID=UPI0024DF4E2B|nr:NTP transferase domain-containing protein [Curtobacterium sp. MCPF17_052]WIB12109.1 NTP transferase domain-containing protein [Curtobacterium sp. MCPF17_052]
MSSTPRVLAVIPARAGSKGIPGKNLRQVAGRTLVARAVRAALAAASVDEVVVSTDGDAIAAEAIAAGARVVRRPADLSGDQASSESALLHALDTVATGHDAPEVLLFLQATSPFIDPADLDRAVARVLDGAADSVLAAAPLARVPLARHRGRLGPRRQPRRRHPPAPAGPRAGVPRDRRVLRRTGSRLPGGPPPLRRARRVGGRPGLDRDRHRRAA